MNKTKSAIMDSGLKQIYIAKKIGIEHTLFSMQLNGHRQMPYDVAKKLAKFLKVPLSNIIDYNVSEIKK
jgi:transcriptional regulator with XRE-family HTH domain